MNKKILKAKKDKKDEFYTQISDIENELIHYKKHFENKIVYCNCDEYKISEFINYFIEKFKQLKLKKLIATCYKNQNNDLFNQQPNEPATYMEFDGKTIVNKNLNYNGDFRNEENIELLKQADVIVTNPPFSLFRTFIIQLIQYDKKFIIIGHQNAFTYKEIFPLIKNNKLWLGYGFKNGIGYFINNYYKDYAKSATHKKGRIRISGVVWFTNLNNSKRTEKLILNKKYIKTKYYNYANYNAINIDKVKDIPYDYKGLMGVPITFLNKFNPKQFELIGLGISKLGIEIGVKQYKPEHRKYRTQIQKKGAVDGDLYIIKNKIVTVPYARIIIKPIKTKN